MIQSECQTATEQVVSSSELQQMLTLARELERHGRRAERFITTQLQQLELAVADLDRERAAWLRQKERETQVLEDMRLEIGQLKKKQKGKTDRSPAVVAVSKPAVPLRGSAAETSLGSAPLRVLLQLGSASNTQVGLLLFEISKLNREIGGQGVRFEIKDCRLHQADSALGRIGLIKRPAEAVVLELEGFSYARLIDAEEAQAIWAGFKSYIVKSSLVRQELDDVFRKGTPTARDHSARHSVSDAAHRAFEANTKCYDDSRSLGPILRAAGTTDAVHQQLHRIEQLMAVLENDHYTAIHTSLV